MQIVDVNISDIKLYEKNNKIHPQEQLDELKQAISEFGFTVPVLLSKNNDCIWGHWRIEAVKQMGWEKVPCVFTKDLNDHQIRKLRLLDNKLAELSEDNIENIKFEITALQDEKLDDLYDYYLDDLANEDFDWDDETGWGSENNYTRKIEAPIYEIKWNIPEIKDLTITSKYDELMEEINKSNVPENIKEFMKASATRHIEFNYAKIAEFYSEADKETQELMEKSALVVIDFEKSIEYGFTKLTDEMKNLYLNANNDAQV